MRTLDNFKKEAKRWLKALRAGDAQARARMHGASPNAPAEPGLRDVQHALAREHGAESWIALRNATALTGSTEPTPIPPDLATYEGLAQDLVFAYETGQPAAMQRLMDHFGAQVTWEQLRQGVRERLDNLPESDRPDGPFALPHAQVLVAQLAGFANWAALAKMLDLDGEQGLHTLPRGALPPLPSEAPVDADVPVEMRTTLPMELQDGVPSTTTEVWDMLTATRDGDLDRVTEMVSRCLSLVHCDYNYMRPLHLAVREGHMEIVRYLLAHGAADPKYVTYPYNETLLTVAQDRGYDEIAQLLVDHLARPDLPDIGDSGKITYNKDDTQRRFEKLVGAGALGGVEALLNERPDLALDETASDAEGILSGPANRRRRPMLELLMRYGARVPDVSKWGREYYFKHYDIAVLLMETGMGAMHMNIHRTTLLHAMAQEGNLQKARLLLDHGADIDAVDQEFRSTPLGLAARWGQREMVGFLLERGAHPGKSGAPWATPLAWARKKGHSGVEADLRQAGARFDA